MRTGDPLIPHTPNPSPTPPPSPCRFSAARDGVKKAQSMLSGKTSDKISAATSDPSAAKKDLASMSASLQSLDDSLTTAQNVDRGSEQVRSIEAAKRALQSRLASTLRPHATTSSFANVINNSPFAARFTRRLAVGEGGHRQGVHVPGFCR